MDKIIEKTINSDFTLEGAADDVAFQIAERFIAPALEATYRSGGKENAIMFMHALLVANINLLSEITDEDEIDELIKTAKQLTFDQKKHC